MVSQPRCIHTTGRNNCGGRCLLHYTVQDDHIVSVTTDMPDCTEAGAPLQACVRGMHYVESFLNERRLRYPMRRVGKRGEGRFERISWDEAVNLIAEEWIRIRDTYGAGSRYVNYATGVSAAFSPSDLARRLLALDGGYLGYYNTYSTGCTALATELAYGTMDSGNAPEDWLNSNLIILWGHNPAETRFDAVSGYYLQKAQKQGIPIVVIDPRCSDTVQQLKAQWIPIRPATDAAMLDAMAYVICTENLLDQDFLDRCCIGFDEDHLPASAPKGASVRSYLFGVQDGVPKTPRWAETITGVPAQTIRNLAIQYATAGPAVLLQGYGPQRNSYGEQVVRGGILLACMTGNVGVSGGWAAGVGYCSRHPIPGIPPIPNPYNRAIPVYRWTDAVERGVELTGLDGVVGREARLDSNIKMILNLAGNCLINQHGDINRTAALLRDESKCEFIVCSDLFMTASAKYADLLLPGISFLEMENITCPWVWGDFVGYNNQVIPPMGEGRFEYDWLSEVAERLGLRQQFTLGRTTEDWLRSIYATLCKQEPELPPFEDFRAAGVYRYRNNPPVIAFRQQRNDPEKYPFPTKSGKIELYSEKVAAMEFQSEFPPIPRYMPPTEGPHDALAQRYPLQLVGWHTKRRCHSIHDETSALQRVDPQQLWMHPKDGAARQIENGSRVRIYNDRGCVETNVFLTERIMPGVVALAQGSWYKPDAEGIDRNGSINVLTSWNDTPYAHGNAQHTNLVEVCATGSD